MVKKVQENSNLKEPQIVELETIRKRLAELEREQKLGLVWRDIPEDVETLLRDEMPVLIHEPDLDIPGKIPSDKSHVLIEGDNLHALHVLQATHRGSVDVIYIDPPYNTGNKDWMYNDQFIDKEDEFRHSKWLSFMHKRLALAKQLLCDTGVLIVSIGNDEAHRLIALCERMFSDKIITQVSVQTSGGKPSGGFNFVHEFLIFVVPQDFTPSATSFTGGNARTPWEGMTLATFNKTQRPNQTYPIFVNQRTGRLHSIGATLAEVVKSGKFKGSLSKYRYEVDETPSGCVAVWPITAKGEECVWRLIPKRLQSDYESGYIKISPNVKKEHKNKFSVQYLPAGVIKKVKSGEIETFGTEPSLPTLQLGLSTTSGADIPTVWTEKLHHTVNGTEILKQILGKKTFQYPKPLQLIEDVLMASGGGKQNGVILDFFAGSGTTLHAVAKLNDLDGGTRQCILVTNNENSICRDVTQPRLKAVLTGKWADKQKHDPLPGSLSFYKTGFIKRLKSPDRMRTEIAKHTIDLIAIKEGAGTTVSRTADLTVLHGLNKTIAVVPGLDPDHVKLHANAEKKVREGDNKTVYLFTWSNQGVEEETAGLWPGWVVEPLPSEMLAALRRNAPSPRLFDVDGGSR